MITFFGMAFPLQGDPKIPQGEPVQQQSSDATDFYGISSKLT